MEDPLKVSATRGDAGEYRALIWQRRSTVRSPITLTDAARRARQRSQRDGTAGILSR